MKTEDYTIEFCPWCETEVAIRAHCAIACPNCGKPIIPCSTCLEGCHANKGCPYGCRNAIGTMKLGAPMTAEETAFAWANC